jgi:hypothetical protein
MVGCDKTVIVPFAMPKSREVPAKCDCWKKDKVKIWGIESCVEDHLLSFNWEGVRYSRDVNIPFERGSPCQWKSGSLIPQTPLGRDATSSLLYTLRKSISPDLLMILGTKSVLSLSAHHQTCGYRCNQIKDPTRFNNVINYRLCANLLRRHAEVAAE